MSFFWPIGPGRPIRCPPATRDGKGISNKRGDGQIENFRLHSLFWSKAVFLEHLSSQQTMLAFPIPLYKREVLREKR